MQNHGQLLIFNGAPSSLDAETTEHFAQTVKLLRSTAGTLFIAWKGAW